MPTVGDILKRFGRAQQERLAWEPLLQDVADLVCPTRQFVTQNSNPGSRRNKIFNDTAPNASASLAAAVIGLLINQASRWAIIQPFDADLVDDQEPMEWLYDCTSRMLGYLHRQETGFMTAADEFSLDLVAMGTAVMCTHESPANLSFQARDLSGFFMLQNDKGEITDQFETFMMTPVEALEKFGGKAGDGVRKLAADPKGCDEKLTFVHYCFKRSDVDPLRRDKLNKPYGSIYVDLKHKVIVGDEGGYGNNPYIVARWRKGAKDCWGTSPAMDVMPSIKTVNVQERTVLMQGEQQVRPPINVFADSFQGSISTLPGAINYFKKGVRDLPNPMNVGGDTRLGLELITRREAGIEKAHFYDAFKLPPLDRMTAEEVITRRQQGLLTAAPVLARLYAEWLNPVVMRTFVWMYRNEMFLPVPRSMAGRAMKISYTGPMAAAMRQPEATAIAQGLASVAPIIEVDPGSAVNIDSDATVRELWNIHNCNPRLLRQKRSVQQMRKQQAESQARSQQAESAQGMAAAGSDAAGALKAISDAGLLPAGSGV